ncbi:hypothetical protein PG984_013825 [Apiospora sp. TS-2023a]
MAAHFNFATPITPITCEDVNSPIIIQGTVPTMAPASLEVLDSLSGARPAARAEQPEKPSTGLPAPTNTMADRPPYLVRLPDGKLVRPPPGLPMPKGMVPSLHQSAVVGHPQIFVPGPPPFKGKLPSTLDELLSITPMERFGIKISPHLGANDIDLAKIAFSWLGYLEELHAHLVAHPHEQRGQDFVDRVSGLGWLVHGLNEIIERGANPCYVRSVFSKRELFPVSMQGEDRKSPLEQARRAIVMLSEASFGEYLAQLADWPYQPKPTVPCFYVKDGQVQWKLSATEDGKAKVYGALDPNFLGALDFVEKIGGEDMLFFNQSQVIEEQRRQELQDSERQPDDNHNNNHKTEPQRHCDRRNSDWDDSSFEYDSNPEENMRKPAPSDPSESESESAGSTDPTSCLKDSDSSTMGSSDSDLIDFNVWQDFGVEEESEDEEGVEYWGDTTYSDSFSSAPSGYVPQFVLDVHGDDNEEVHVDIAYFGDDEDSDDDDDDDDDDDEEPALSPLDHVRSVIDLLGDMISGIDTLVDSASELEETPSPELEEIDLAFAHNWYRQAQHVNHGEDDVDEDDGQEPEWLYDQDIEIWNIHSLPPVPLKDTTTYLNHVDQTIQRNYYDAISYTSGDIDESEDDPKWLDYQWSDGHWDIVDEHWNIVAMNNRYFDFNRAITNRHSNNNGDEGEGHHDDEEREDSEVPQLVNNGGDEPSDNSDSDSNDDDDDKDGDTPKQQTLRIVRRKPRTKKAMMNLPMMMAQGQRLSNSPMSKAHGYPSASPGLRSMLSSAFSPSMRRSSHLPRPS